MVDVRIYTSDIPGMIQRLYLMIIMIFILTLGHVPLVQLVVRGHENWLTVPLQDKRAYTTHFKLLHVLHLVHNRST